MKWIAYILSVYILILASLPCGDREEAIHNQGQSFGNLHLPSDCQHENDLCSPLCFCTCCGGITIACYAPFTLNIYLEFVSSISIYKSLRLSDFTKPFWQPPKL